MDEIALITMPYELDRLREGVGRGPEHLLASGAEDALASGGATVRQETLELSGSFDNEVDASFELIRLVSHRVRAAVVRGAFPVVLSGSCFAAVGVVAGLGEAAPAVVWFDAHGDFNEPATAISGYFDGMGLAVLTGSAWRALHATVPGARPLPESAVVLAGARDFDPPEEERLAASEITWLAPPNLAAAEALGQAVGSLRPTPTGVYVHVDLDVLDGDDGRVNVYSAPGGLTGEQLEARVRALVREQPVRALSLTAYDPASDVADRVPAIARGLLRVIAEHVRARD